MTAAYAPESWDGFALAVVTAAATLTRLLFVAVSINLQRILSFPNLVPALPPAVGLCGRGAAPPTFRRYRRS